MKYNCGHLGCDLCGIREYDARLKQYGKLFVCDSCVTGAISSVYDFACKWGGTILDDARECKKHPTPTNQKGEPQ